MLGLVAAVPLDSIDIVIAGAGFFAFGILGVGLVVNATSKIIKEIYLSI